jgi:hypothetical protein
MNFYNWIGGETEDMVRILMPFWILYSQTNGGQSDKTKAAFDPIFLSYHCNMDRLIDHYLCSNSTLSFTSNVPLRPFINGGTEVDYANTNPWAYATIGDMAKNTACNGYVYVPPACPDLWTSDQAILPMSSGCRASSVLKEARSELSGIPKSNNAIVMESE